MIQLSEDQAIRLVGNLDKLTARCIETGTPWPEDLPSLHAYICEQLGETAKNAEEQPKEEYKLYSLKKVATFINKAKDDLSLSPYSGCYGKLGRKSMEQLLCDQGWVIYAKDDYGTEYKVITQEGQKYVAYYHKVTGEGCASSLRLTPEGMKVFTGSAFLKGLINPKTEAGRTCECGCGSACLKIECAD